MKPLAALLTLALIYAIGRADGWIEGKQEEQTPVAVVKESGHREMVCE